MMSPWPGRPGCRPNPANLSQTARPEWFTQCDIPPSGGPGCGPAGAPGIMRSCCSGERPRELAGLHRVDQRHQCQVTSMSLFAFVWQVCGDGCGEPGGNTIG